MDRHPAFKKIFCRLQQRRQAARIKAVAVCSDAAATLELVRRARAARQGESYQLDPEPTFVPQRRSRFEH